jgi:DNA-binding TFAR19-related protein (PDSD5 family)
MNETKVDQVMEENPSFQIEISSVSRVNKEIDEDKIKRILEKLQIQ